MASTEYMNRQKLVVIVVTGVFLALAAVVIVISVIFAQNPEPVSTPTPTTTKSSDVLTDADNDYSQDEGYIPLAENFDPNLSPTENTIYNDTFSYFTMNRLMCELSNKTVITEKALEPAESYFNDLSLNTSPYAVDARSQGSKTLEKLREKMGQPLSAQEKSDLAFMYCNAQEVDFEQDEHDHN